MDLRTDIEKYFKIDRQRYDRCIKKTASKLHMSIREVEKSLYSNISIQNLRGNLRKLATGKFRLSKYKLEEEVWEMTNMTEFVIQAAPNKGSKNPSGYKIVFTVLRSGKIVSTSAGKEDTFLSSIVSSVLGDRKKDQSVSLEEMIDIFDKAVNDSSRDIVFYIMLLASDGGELDLLDAYRYFDGIFASENCD